MKKILILYCQYGGGHLSAAKNLKEFKSKIVKDIENLTAMNVIKLDVIAKNIQMPGE